MSNIFKKNNIVQPTQTINYNGKSIPFARKYIVVENSNVPIDPNKLYERKRDFR